MSKRRDPFTLSIVVPFYRESQTINAFFKRSLPIFRDLAVNFEVIAIDDGSDDDTWEKLLSISNSCPQLKLIQLSRNYGHQVALTAGLDYASGDAVVIMDGDLQDPPELIGEMLEKWKKGADLVNAARRVRRGENAFKLVSAKLFYKIINKFSSQHLPQNVGDFRLLDQQAVIAIRRMRERHRYLRGMFACLGFKQDTLEFDREPRTEGESKYTFVRMLGLALNGIFSFSRKPLQIATILGLIFSTLSACYMIWIIIRALFYHEALVGGWASILVVVLFIGGLQLVCLGLIGEYVGRTFEEVKHRPLYLISNHHGAFKPPLSSPLAIEDNQMSSDFS